MLAVREFDEKLLIVATRDGQIKKTVLGGDAS